MFRNLNPPISRTHSHFAISLICFITEVHAVQNCHHWFTTITTASLERTDKQPVMLPQRSKHFGIRLVQSNPKEAPCTWQFYRPAE